jgi:hypothetical protein
MGQGTFRRGSFFKFTRLAAIAAVALFAFLAVHLGCTSAQLNAIERDARAVQYVTSPVPVASPAVTPATTRPSMLDAARVAVQSAGSVYPPLSLILSVVSIVAGAVATSARRQLNTATAQLTTAHTVIGEIVSDVKENQQPAEPWSDTAADLLMQLGHVAFAQPATQTSTPK